MYNIQISKYPNIQISKYPKLSKNLLKFSFSALFLCAGMATDVRADCSSPYRGECICTSIGSDSNTGVMCGGTIGADWGFGMPNVDACISYCNTIGYSAFNVKGDGGFIYRTDTNLPDWTCFGFTSDSGRGHCCRPGDNCDPTATRHSQTGAPKAVSTPKTKSAVNKPSQK